MNIDFHYGVIYVVARLAGMDTAQAKVVAHACQYVDDATTPGVLIFEGGESFERFASAHRLFDYHNLLNGQNRLVWAPFHFLPGGEGKTLEERALCRPDSAIARAMVKRAIAARTQANGLHRLGVTLHVYVDTWAHQGFSGTVSKYNQVTELHGDDHDEATWLGKLAGFVSDTAQNVKAQVLDAVCNLGHGAALHFPDMPWARWHYVNGHGIKVARNNLPDFLRAADMSYRAVRGYLNGNAVYEAENGLPTSSLQALEGLLETSRSHDEQERLGRLRDAAARGEIPGLKEAIPDYIPKGKGSWKHLATGIEEAGDGGFTPRWSEKFEGSDYRHFHDAIKEHRFVVTQQILPEHGVRLA
jgi:hypothetical protein